jgi:hypothetical protein
MAVYLELRVFHYDSERDGPYEPAAGTRIDELVVPFANLANATAVFEDARPIIERAIAKGFADAPDRVKPGIRRRIPDAVILDVVAAPAPSRSEPRALSGGFAPLED